MATVVEVLSRDVLGSRLGDPEVGGLGDAQPARREDPDARVALRQVAQDLRRAVLGAVVHQDPLEVGEGLRQDARDRPIHVGLAVVDRRHHAHPWASCHRIRVGVPGEAHRARPCPGRAGAAADARPARAGPARRCPREPGTPTREPAPVPARSRQHEPHRLLIVPAQRQHGHHSVASSTSGESPLERGQPHEGEEDGDEHPQVEQQTRRCRSPPRPR